MIHDEKPKFESVVEKGDSQYWRNAFFREEIEHLDREAYEFVLSDSKGRWFLMRLFDNTYVNATTFTGNSQSFFNEGKRAVAVNIVNKIAQLLGINGINAKQLAEREYIDFMARAKAMAAKKDSEREEI